ncbi:MAG: hypothetical protein OEY14_16220 [Myxococcales bacterium]|nr:hypothetical protein [Myxococcales bacterium]
MRIMIVLGVGLLWAAPAAAQSMARSNPWTEPASYQPLPDALPNLPDERSPHELPRLHLGAHTGAFASLEETLGDELFEREGESAVGATLLGEYPLARYLSLVGGLDAFSWTSFEDLEQGYGRSQWIGLRAGARGRIPLFWVAELYAQLDAGPLLSLLAASPSALGYYAGASQGVQFLLSGFGLYLEWSRRRFVFDHRYAGASHAFVAVTDHFTLGIGMVLGSSS